MTTLGNAGRVGLVFVAAVLALGGAWTFLKGNLLNSNTYSFDVLFTDASGVTAETPVTLAGVQIGKVASVTLTPSQQADLKLEIKDKLNGREVRIPHGSQFLIATPILGTTGTIMVIPPTSAALRSERPIRDGEADLRGTKVGDLTASLNKATALLDQVIITTKKANALLDSATSLTTDPKLRRSLYQTLDNVNLASRNGLQLTGKLNGLLAQDNDQILALLQQTKAGTQVSLDNLAATTGSVRQITAENKSQIAAIVRNLNDTTSAVAGITGQANNALSKGGITQNLGATVANLKATTDKLNVIAGNFEKLSSVATDPKVQSNLKDTVQNIRDSTEQAEFLLERLNKIVGGKRKGVTIVAAPGVGAVILPGTTPSVTPAPLRGAPYYLPRVQAVYNIRDRHLRTDIDVLVPLSVAPVTFVRAGIYGFGDTNKLILQGGQALDKNGLVTGRVGIYASKLSVGADVGLGRRETLSIDAYDPNNFRVDAKGTLMLAPELGLVLGGENLNHSNRSSALIGLEYRKSK